MGGMSLEDLDDMRLHQAALEVKLGDTVKAAAERRHVSVGKLRRYLRRAKPDPRFGPWPQGVREGRRGSIE